MNTRSVMAHGILAVGSMLLAYLVWTDDGPGQDVDEVTIFECSPEDLTSLRLALADKDVELELEGEGDAREGWITLERHPESGEPSRERFIASDSLGEVLEQLAPLRARRSLGQLSEEQLADIGLDEPEGSLELRCGERTEAFEIGGRAYGSGDRYARQGATVYLIGNERLQPIESAELRLMERRLHTFEWTEVTELELSAFERDKRLLHRNRNDEATEQWVDAERPDVRNELFGNWLSAYPRMRVQRYIEGEPGTDLDDDAAPAPVDVMRITFQGEDGELGRLELRRVDVSPPAYYARTETTRGWVRVPPSVAQSFEDDARPVLGLDPIERAPQTPEGAETEAEAGADAEAGAEAEAGADADAEAEAGAEAEADADAEAGADTEPTPALPPGHP